MLNCTLYTVRCIIAANLCFYTSHITRTHTRAHSFICMCLFRTLHLKRCTVLKNATSHHTKMPFSSFLFFIVSIRMPHKKKTNKKNKTNNAHLGFHIPNTKIHIHNSGIFLCKIMCTCVSVYVSA